MCSGAVARDGAMSGVKCQPPDTPQPSESGWLMNPPQSPLCHCRRCRVLTSLTSQVCTVCGAVQHCAHCPRPAPGCCCCWPGSESCGHHESPPPPQLVILTPFPCSAMLTAMIWLHVDYDMIIWRDYDMRYEIWLHCPSVRHCGSVVSALLSAVHHITQMLPAISTVHHPHPPLHCTLAGGMSIICNLSGVQPSSCYLH